MSKRVSFSVLAEDGLARVGRLTTQNGELSTPCLLTHTSRAVPVHLMIDNLHDLQPRPQGAHICATHFLEYPSPAQLKASGGGVHAFTGMENVVLLASPQDATNHCLSNAPRKANDGPMLLTPGGYKLTTPEQYAECLVSLRADLHVALYDEVPAHSSAKRIKQSVDRTARWSAQCPTPPEVAGTALAAVVGADSMEERARSAELAVAASNDVAGFALMGFGMGESPEERARLLECCLTKLPPGKPKYLAGLGAPHQLLQSIAMGVDVADSTYALKMSTSGYALTFPVTERGLAHPQESDAVQGRDHTKINLKAVGYRRDLRPLLPGCTCYACTAHTRAYIHHLLNVHEMLADVLLEIHNNTHMQAFFVEIRTAIREQRFRQYVQKMEEYLQAGQFTCG